MRFKNRYILFEVVRSTGATTISRQVLWKLIKESIEENFGDFGCSKLFQTLSIKFYSDLTHLLVLKVDRDFHHIAWAAISFIKSVKTERIMFRSIAVTGHLVKCCKSAAAIVRERMNAKDCTDEEKLALNSELKDLMAAK
mmetsp:Transcript_7190/g.13770  ORF Transcript_7190/g.13770 Transcript_7190/m.13770 type:complete len:140 (+) Transcript_7190:171-590(+)|eukprot:CAMPEP_0167805010 /NCGR_PEP_ID=MMETSP0111_2-20121227/20886_1 /TAXON_ID=91324 /ORGANISM="Lotharella globosa, Strain CCCM811" /LENGTH=139 /DNA_ID=CAMNT_0007702007 /DNA_START=70 /DNA_END=492 /DNA_ORIENTATION=-